jgi:hypothetical protein
MFLVDFMQSFVEMESSFVAVVVVWYATGILCLDVQEIWMASPRDHGC